MPYVNKFLARLTARPGKVSGTPDDYSTSAAAGQKRKATLQPLPAETQRQVHFPPDTMDTGEGAEEAEEDAFTFPLDPKALRDYESSISPSTVGTMLGKKLRKSTN